MFGSSVMCHTCDTLCLFLGGPISCWFLAISLLANTLTPRAVSTNPASLWRHPGQLGKLCCPQGSTLTVPDNFSTWHSIPAFMVLPMPRAHSHTANPSPSGKRKQGYCPVQGQVEKTGRTLQAPSSSLGFLSHRTGLIISAYLFQSSLVKINETMYV